MKRLVIFVNGNYFTAIIQDAEKLASIMDDLADPTSGSVSFTSDNTGVSFYAERKKIDGWYTVPYVEPPPDNNKAHNERLFNLLKKLVDGGDEWKEGA